MPAYCADSRSAARHHIQLTSRVRAALAVAALGCRLGSSSRGHGAAGFSPSHLRPVVPYGVDDLSKTATENTVQIPVYKFTLPRPHSLP